VSWILSVILERIGYLGPLAIKQMDVAAYLERIGYSGPLTPSPEALRNLHRAHLFTVPFENLDISSGRKVVLDEDALVRKVVEKRRGGFCYELNSAFAALLRALGFDVTLLSARVARSDGGMSPEFDHLTLRVDLDEPWLADVGFGDSFLEPLVLKPSVEQQQGDRKFRIVENDAGLTLQRAERLGIWKPEYSFDLRPRRLHELLRCATITRPRQNPTLRRSDSAPWPQWTDASL